jgi:hypothetical protein
MPIRHGFIASSVALAPTVSLSAASNFNQSIATLNATVSANFYSTTVKFQYNKTNNFSSYSEVNAATTPITGQSVSSYANITGLDENSTYYFRCVATNAIGTTTTSVSSFVTWAKQTFSKTASGTWNITIPTVTPTGGSIVVPSITSVQLVGAGAGGNGGGGGGGAGYSSATLTFASGSSTAISVVVGAGGGAGSAGGSSSISNLSVSAAGGNAPTGDVFTGRAGSSGSGNLGGTNTGAIDKNGNIVSWGYGGGGGNAGGGGSAAPDYGGAGGGPSSCVYGGGTFGGGGGGDGAVGDGSNGGGNYGVGGNGAGGASGSPGRVYFQYYASSDLAP